jgi:hypothetical protein
LLCRKGLDPCLQSFGCDRTWIVTVHAFN